VCACAAEHQLVHSRTPLVSWEVFFCYLNTNGSADQQTDFIMDHFRKSFPLPRGARRRHGMCTYIRDLHETLTTNGIQNPWQRNNLAGYEVLTKVVLKRYSYCDITLCGPLKSKEVSEEHVASISRAEKAKHTGVEAGNNTCQSRYRTTNENICYKTNSVALSPQANYTDWATATCRRNLVPNFVDRGVSRGQRGGFPTVVNLQFSRREPLLFFQVAPHLSPRSWVDPIPDPLLLRKFGSAGNRTPDLTVSIQKLWLLDHRGGRTFTT
jgi:hypothetical protein